MRKDNRGFSLIEMIIVIAIAAILVGSSLVMVRQISFANTEKTTETIASMLDRYRITAMGKTGKWYIYIYHLSDGCYIKALDGVKLDTFDASQLDSNGTKICGDRINIYIGSVSGTKVDGSNIIRINYTRTGLFSADTNVFTGGGNEGKIVVDGTGTRTLSLIRSTGKNYTD